jgi:hypothetical protein
MKRTSCSCAHVAPCTTEIIPWYISTLIIFRTYICTRTRSCRPHRTRGASAGVCASTPVIAASVFSSAIAGARRTAPTPTARPAKGAEGLSADVGEEERQAGAGTGAAGRASRELPDALAERCAHVRPVPVHLHIGRVSVGFQASWRRSAARGLTSCFCRQRWSYGWCAALVTLSSGRSDECRVWG